MEVNKELQAMRPARIFLLCFVAYWVIMCAFYWLAGEQLHYRESCGNIQLPAADKGAAELHEGVLVDQVFTPEIGRLHTVGVQFATYYRTNAGKVCIELYDTVSGALLMRGVFDAAEITDGQVLTISADEPVETDGQTPLALHLYADSQPGSAVIPLMTSAVQRDGETLYIHNTDVAGTLCFSASGSDAVWIGAHYWTVTVVFGVLLALFFLLVLYRKRKGKRSYVINALVAVQKYRFLIRQLVSRDFKTKYKRSVLGMLWSFLNPLLMMTVQYFVFSTIFESDIAHYPVYLLMGIVSFNFFSEACGMSLTSILGNASLITKVYMPKYIYPLSRVISSVVNLGISLIPLVLVALATGVQFRKSAVLALWFFACLIIFALGLGLVLSAAMVFFRDTQFLWGVLSTIWMYATPIFYPESILPDEFRFVLEINPLYYFLKNARICVLDGISPEPLVYLQCIGITLVMLLIGSVFFRKAQDRFVLYL